eukprot:m.288516 g.288516  ORF g.288516 m.288516 type:complete len:93 (-) comp55044_c0_seq6:1250-1528(-)
MLLQPIRRAPSTCRTREFASGLCEARVKGFLQLPQSADPGGNQERAGQEHLGCKLGRIDSRTLRVSNMPDSALEITATALPSFPARAVRPHR